jgi:hypothetical protein
VCDTLNLRAAGVSVRPAALEKKGPIPQLNSDADRGPLNPPEAMNSSISYSIREPIVRANARETSRTMLFGENGQMVGGGDPHHPDPTQVEQTIRRD